MLWTSFLHMTEEKKCLGFWNVAVEGEGEDALLFSPRHGRRDPAKKDINRTKVK